MPAQARTPRDDWIAAGLKALARGGPEAVRVEPLARELGATKGSFYWHFNDRAMLLEALLDDWERTVVDDVVAQIEGGGGDARDRLRRLFALAAHGATCPPSNSRSATGPGATPPLPTGSSASTIAGSTTCGHCSLRSRTTTPTPRSAAPSRSRYSSDTR